MSGYCRTGAWTGGRRVLMRTYKLSTIETWLTRTIANLKIESHPTGLRLADSSMNNGSALAWPSTIQSIRGRSKLIGSGRAFCKHSISTLLRYMRSLRGKDLAALGNVEVLRQFGREYSCINYSEIHDEPLCRVTVVSFEEATADLYVSSLN